ncbi:MAG: hypothetical protein JW840_02790 [Candidatus Thermoplasmatota archaeon]|nr:hypothetical protein [Candidatus Thermoplasmatota archaeon]
MKKESVMLLSILLMCILSLVPVTASSQVTPNEYIPLSLLDYDPLVDINITVAINAIRALDKIDITSGPDLFITLIINGAEYTSPIWNDMRYIYDCYAVTVDVPDDKKLVEVVIQLWENNGNENRLCDISSAPNSNGSGLDISLQYDISSGRWSGDNNNFGDTGYGRVCGSADGSIYTNEYDCEVWFTISQNDFDNDGLAYWVETNVYDTDPTINDAGQDDDTDGIPIEWEHRFGFNPSIWDDHMHLDPDGDSLNNIEEYQTWAFGSDPFRKDIFLEIDYMQESNGDVKYVSTAALELVKNPYHRRNIVFHFDTGQLDGGDIVPYDEKITFEKIRSLWNTYFLHNDTNNWRRGVFHYVLFVPDQKPGAYAFSGDVPPYWGYIPGTNGFTIATSVIEKKAKIPLLTADHITASLIVHEMGHNLGIRFGRSFGCDNKLTSRPWRIGWYIWRNYRSIMNYRYTYTILDYSDGSHGKKDYDDWENIDLGYFEKPK